MNVRLPFLRMSQGQSFATVPCGRGSKRIPDDRCSFSLDLDGRCVVVNKT